ncbi:uncharacterized protein LOC133313740 [Gastrolobium bilobum]|uniref:uncharacterized protein LOC133313740 n=1 Tax=Gastrolobium bilobum TaxID=150636 RepID=UPI002AB25310|nr:uncharacterized protein LOC133313740 [Gastrolobium bilobum]
MENQSFGRPQRPKGGKIKQALKVIVVLSVCAWLVYQIRHSRNKTKNYGSQTKLIIELELARINEKFRTNIEGKEMELQPENQAKVPSKSNYKESRMQENVVEIATNAGVTEEIDGVQSFHDENGVPPDGNETEIVAGQAHMLREENISNVDKGSWFGKK